MAISQSERRDLVRGFWVAFPEQAEVLAILCRRLFVVMSNVDWIGLMKAEVALNPTQGLSVAAFQAELQRIYDATE
jgi:hypothetical protein